MRLAARLCNDASLMDSPVIAWEECACLLCGCADYAPLLEASDALGAGLRFPIVRCNHCGLCFTNPRPDLVSIKQFYPADYHCHHRERLAEACQASNRRFLSRVAPLVPRRSHGPARLLDFGCGAGDCLRRMHALGWNVTGLDMAEPAVARIREQDGLPAHVGTLPHPCWTTASFEAITMWQSLEHVHQPLDVLRAAHRLLTAGGRLLVAVPNFDGSASRWFGANWFGLDLPRHLTHFTPRTLRMMLGRAGFEHVELRQERRSSWIRHSAELARRRDLMTCLLGTRLGSGLASWWGRLIARSECLVAVAAK
jgi:SAM-dependent methyltransferase